MNHAPRSRLSPGTAGALLVALAAGLFARLFQIEIQVPMDDEWHAIAKAASASYGEIVLSFGLADHSIPIALLYRWLLENGRLSEAWMLAPPLVAGILTAVLLVAAVRRAIAPRALALYALLLAISPLLVLYARQARPYALSVALALAAAWAAYRWWQERRFAHAALYCASAPLAVWLHLIVAPFALGVGAALFAEWLWSPRRDVRRLAALAVLVGVAVTLSALLVGPPLLQDAANLRAKAAQDFPNAHSLVRTAALFAGTGSAMPALVLGIVAVPGLAWLYRARPEATRIFGMLVVLQVAAVLASRAYLLHYPLVLARYLLVCLPFLLLAVAVGGAQALGALGRHWPRAPWVAGYGAIALLAWLGPLPQALRYPNSFFGHHAYFFEFDESENAVAKVLRPGPMPEFYRRLGEAPAGSLTILEAPWRYESIFNRLPYFQQVHRQRVKVGMVGGLCPPGGRAEQPRAFRNKLRTVVDLDRSIEGLRREADYLVLHRALDLPNLSGPWLLPGGRALPDVGACIERFVRDLGPPVYEDATITAFRLRAP